MTAAELYDIVSEWPKEARPEDVRWWDAGKQWNTIGECVLRPLPGSPGNTSVPISDAHAVLLHEAGGARWLDGNLPAAWTRTWRRAALDAPPIYEVWFAGEIIGEGSTRIAAIDAAIRAEITP